MLLQKAKRSPLFLAIAGIVLILVLAFAWWTISPLFIRTTLVEGQNIPVPAASNSVTDNESMESPAKVADTMPEVKENVEQAPAPTTEPVGSADKPTENMEETTGNMGSVAEPTIEPPAEESMASTTEEQAGPVVFATGNFDHKDSVHYADGQAILARDAEGNNILRLQDLNSVNGPDLYVYVSEHPNPNSSSELHTGEHNLGSLKATNGSFSYALDPSIDVSKVKSVVIYCKAFSVIFSTAALQAAQQ